MVKPDAMPRTIGTTMLSSNIVTMTRQADTTYSLGPAVALTEVKIVAGSPKIFEEATKLISTKGGAFMSTIVQAVLRLSLRALHV